MKVNMGRDLESQTSGSYLKIEQTLMLYKATFTNCNIDLFDSWCLHLYCTVKFSNIMVPFAFWDGTTYGDLLLSFCLCFSFSFDSLDLQHFYVFLKN